MVEEFKGSRKVWLSTADSSLAEERTGIRYKSPARIPIRQIAEFCDGCDHLTEDIECEVVSYDPNEQVSRVVIGECTMATENGIQGRMTLEGFTTK